MNESKYSLDEAFNWLVLILSIIAGALSQYPELYPSPPFITPKAGVNIALLRILIFPIIILALLWLWSLLTKRTDIQVIIKSFSWILAFMVLIEDLVLFLFSSISPYFPGGEGPGALLPILILIFTSPLYLSIILFIRVIRHRLMEIYKEDATFLNRPFESSFLYIWAVFYWVFYYWYFIAMG